ncbi:class I SAM-dependent methyltransferase [Fulvivirga kasyanovii]|uniref:Methyltransferase domain-containing protein n=1 Tax=Fulvivirga kasyanovii TaxID=396812 RepID=A0ABW9RSX0_9BACT|nr:class I SAM-dependent methyltransferase [Fulvivirga kasyanovii]MTI26816.1 methyltransferase domain-containing protein [Fulvivirga kasyanovii]
MENSWQKYWDERFRNKAYAYGKQPNSYLKEQLKKLAAGKILFAAEGEGRNAVYAARLGWKVSAFDISIEGKNKALQLANEHDVTLDYQVGQLPELGYEDGQFDAIALIYAHFPANIKSDYHKLLDKYLARGGTIIFEAFSKNHLEYRMKNERAGGPRDIESLFSVEELRSDFVNYEILELEEREVTLNEGLFHNGKSSVIRFVGRKK